MKSVFSQISEHSYCLESKSTRRSLIATVIGDDQVLYVDAGTSPMHMQTMLDHFEQINFNDTIRPIGVLTDSGLKHILGMQACGKMPFIAHALTKSKLDEMSTWEFSDKFLDKKVASREILASDLKALKKEWEEPRDVEIMIPCILYRHQLELDLGHVSVLLEHLESDHSEESTIVYIKEDEVLFIGDILEPAYQGHSPYYTKQVLNVIDALMKYKAKYYITSKTGKIYSQNDFFEYCEYIRIVGATVSEYFNDVSMIQETLGGNLDKNANALISAFMNGLKVDTKI